MKLQGKCLCEAITLSIETEDETFGACHCSMCRRWGGGPLLAVHAESLEVNSTEQVSLYSSSDWAERAFCKTCGSHLYYKLKDRPMYAVPIGCLENQEKLHFKSQIFIDHKPSHYDFANQTYNMTEAEVLEVFAK